MVVLCLMMGLIYLWIKVIDIRHKEDQVKQLLVKFKVKTSIRHKKQKWTPTQLRYRLANLVKTLQ